MMKANALAEAIRRIRVGDTPMLQLPKALLAALGIDACRALVKDERQNPTGTLKARTARAMLLQAAEDEKLRPTTTVIEASSGSTAVAEAYVAGQVGLRCMFFVPNSISANKITRILAFGNAEVQRVEGSSEDARAAAEAWVTTHPELDLYYVDQYTNTANPAAHILTTGPEILAQTQRLEMIIAGLGTGGTTCGLKQYFDGTGVRIVGVQPDRKVHRIDGLKHFPSLAPQEVPRVAALHLLDDIVFVSSDEAHEMVRMMSRHGLEFGPSSGAVLAALVQLCQRKGAPVGQVVLVYPDDLGRYVTKYSDLLEEKTAAVVV